MFFTIISLGEFIVLSTSNGTRSYSAIHANAVTRRKFSYRSLLHIYFVDFLQEKTLLTRNCHVSLCVVIKNFLELQFANVRLNEQRRGVSVLCETIKRLVRSFRRNRDRSVVASSRRYLTAKR